MAFAKQIVRNWIEEYTDNILKDPQSTENAVKIEVAKVGIIDPDVDSVLSFIYGIIMGTIAGMCDMMDELDSIETPIEFIPLIKRRINEINDSMMNLRFKQ